MKEITKRYSDLFFFVVGMGTIVLYIISRLYALFFTYTYLILFIIALIFGFSLGVGNLKKKIHKLYLTFLIISFPLMQMLIINRFDYYGIEITTGFYIEIFVLIIFSFIVGFVTANYILRKWVKKFLE